jgi:hypothetical protein
MTTRIPAVRPAEERRGSRSEAQPGGRVVDRLENIVRVFGSDSAAAEALAVSRAQPRRWREGQVPDPENRDRIVGLDAVLALLAGYLEASTIPKWLNGINGHLGNRRPINVLRQGRLSEVIAAIEAEKSGAFT